METRPDAEGGRSRNFASVTDPARVGELMRAIDGYSGYPVTALALKLAPLVFVRPGELRIGWPMATPAMARRSARD